MIVPRGVLGDRLPWGGGDKGGGGYLYRTALRVCVREPKGAVVGRRGSPSDLRRGSSGASKPWDSDPEPRAPVSCALTSRPTGPSSGAPNASGAKADRRGPMLPDVFLGQ